MKQKRRKLRVNSNFKPGFVASGPNKERLLNKFNNYPIRGTRFLRNAFFAFLFKCRPVRVPTFVPARRIMLFHLLPQLLTHTAIIFWVQRLQRPLVVGGIKSGMPLGSSIATQVFKYGTKFGTPLWFTLCNTVAKNYFIVSYCL